MVCVEHPFFDEPFDRLADRYSGYAKIGCQFPLGWQRVVGTERAIRYCITYDRLDLTVQRLLPVRAQLRYARCEFAHWPTPSLCRRES